MTKEEILELAHKHFLSYDAEWWGKEEDFAREIWLKGHWEGGNDVSNDNDNALKECQDKLNSILAIIND